MGTYRHKDCGKPLTIERRYIQLLNRTIAFNLYPLSPQEIHFVLKQSFGKR